MASGQSQVPGMMSVLNIEETFNFPSRDHSNKIVQVPIYKLKIDRPEGLKAWCHAFQLKTSLKKAGLQEELVKFSNSPEFFKPGAQQPHKGPHGPISGAKKAVKLTGSRKQQQEMFPSTAVDGDAGTSASDDDKNLGILAWVKKLALAHGKVLTYTCNDVPDQLVLRFSKNLVQLWKIWDDELLHEFDPKDCPLKVNGVLIALKYWDQLYSHECHDKSDKRWKGYKTIVYLCVFHVAVRSKHHISSESPLSLEMGLKNWNWNEFDSSCKLRSFSHLAIIEGFHTNNQNLRGIIVGVDAHNFLAQFSGTFAHGQVYQPPNPLCPFFFRLCEYVKLAIGMVWVYDGPARP
uniref:Uncharacterized protein n=1 Tax=Moniliophthora roreri TaxID=221103 RepID=A0A0W0EVU0_MONRR